MTTTAANRRQFMAALGAAGTIAVAGCLSGDQPQGNSTTTAPETDSEEGLPAAKAVDVDRIARDPTDVPPAVDWTEPREHDVTVRTERLVAEIEPGVTFEYMTFEGQVPGPMIRVREGDRVNLTFDVPAELNKVSHNMDFHAVYGPGGGAEATTVGPGDDTAEISFTADYPGVFIYHCAIPNMAAHISAGMFGAILVEPADGLPEVDREFYLGQHELYTNGDLGEEGHHALDYDAMLAERPTYVVFNGQPYGFTADGVGPMQATTGETARVYFANGGPNLTSAVHPIGNVWSRYYRDGDLLSDPARNVETAPVAPGTTTAGEMEFPVPGPVKLVDHALTRATKKGALAEIHVDGEPTRDLYDETP